MISTCGCDPVRLSTVFAARTIARDLHLVDLRPKQAEPATARPEHRVRLVEREDALAHPLVCGLLERRQELVQRRVEQPDRHRQSLHRLEDALEVGLLHRLELGQRDAALDLVDGHDHLADDRAACPPP